MGYCYLLQFVLKAKKRCNRINQNLLKGDSFMKERACGSKAFWLIMLAFLMTFSLVGCSGGEKDVGLKGGFETGSGEPSPSINVAFITEKSRLKVGEDLTVTVCYGSNNGTATIDPSPLAVTAELLMSRGHFRDGIENPKPIGEDVLLQEIADFWAEEYKWRFDAEGKFVGMQETVQIPAEWFIDDIGAFSWALTSLCTFSEDSPEREIRESDSIALYYRIDGENVILYASFHDFVNDVRK